MTLRQAGSSGQGSAIHHLQAVDLLEPRPLATWEVDLLSGEAECRELLEVCPHSEHIFPGSAGEIQLEQGGTALCRCALEDCGLDGGRKGMLVSAMKRMKELEEK
jgi:hypothetical protein